MSEPAVGGRAQASASRPVTGGETISQAGERRSAQVESLRALAALGVLFGHVAALTYALPAAGLHDGGLDLVKKAVFAGGFGVYFFFALTGYLLFWPFAKRYFGGGDPVDLGGYALNRALRILPLYYAVVLIVLSVEGAGSAVWTHYLTFTENFVPVLHEQALGPAWSLVVELHFYLLLPLSAWLLARVTGGSRRSALAVLLGVGALGLAVRYAGVIAPANPDRRLEFSLPATFLFFIPGMLLALLRLSWEERRPRWLRGAVARADLWLLASLPLFALVSWRFDLNPLIAAGAFLVVGACVLPLRPGPLTNALRWRPLAILGVASYSLYLWQIPVLEGLRHLGVPPTFAPLAVTGVPLAIIVALVSYAVIEAPFLRLRRQWARAAPQQLARAPAGTAVAATGAEHDS